MFGQTGFVLQNNRRRRTLAWLNMAVYIPLLGRLSLNDYKRILLTCLVLLADVTLRLFLFLVPKQLQNWLDRSHSRFVPLRILRGINSCISIYRFLILISISRL